MLYIFLAFLTFLSFCSTMIERHWRIFRASRIREWRSNEKSRISMPRMPSDWSIKAFAVTLASWESIFPFFIRRIHCHAHATENPIKLSNATQDHGFWRSQKIFALVIQREAFSVRVDFRRWKTSMLCLSRLTITKSSTQGWDYDRIRSVNLRFCSTVRFMLKRGAHTSP